MKNVVPFLTAIAIFLAVKTIIILKTSLFYAKKVAYISVYTHVSGNFKNMHSNLWAFLYLTLVPSGLFLLIFFILRLTNGKFYKFLLYIAIVLLLFPIAFIFETFTTVKKEMKLRAGTYVVTRQENLSALCKDIRFDSLTLTLDKEGTFRFNYKPCFADKIGGHWDWEDNMVAAFTTFDHISDSLSLYYPIDKISDTIILKSRQTPYLLFTKE